MNIADRIDHCWFNLAIQYHDDSISLQFIYTLKCNYKMNAINGVKFHFKKNLFLVTLEIN